MKSMNLLSDIEFHDKNPFAQPLFADKAGRILRFTLQPGQGIVEHQVHDSPFYLIVLQGSGFFSGKGGKEKQFAPYSLLIFEMGEKHTIRALDEPLVFVGFLHGASGVPAKKITGTIPQQSKKKRNP